MNSSTAIGLLPNDAGMNTSARMRVRIVKSLVASEFIPFDVSRFRAVLKICSDRAVNARQRGVFGNREICTVAGS